MIERSDRCFFNHVLFKNLHTNLGFCKLLKKLQSQRSTPTRLLPTSTMPVKAIPKISRALNGIGAYVVPCHKIKINYCNWGGSSKGIRELLKAGEINQLGSTKKSIFFEILKRQGHPTIEFHYNNATIKDIAIKNLSRGDILKKIDEYSQSSGADLFKWNHKVLSTNESVRGIWSPMHVPKEFRHKI